MDASVLVAGNGLSRRFGATTALDRVDLTVRRGEPLALFGVNGAGKTTLIRILAGALKPTSGSLIVDRGRIGLVTHRTLLYDDLSALQNLVFFGRLYGLADPEKRARDLLEAAELTDRADEPVRGFSRGLQQRVAIARALMHDPLLLLLDEPSSGLDARSASRLGRTLEGAGARGVTWVLASHDVEEGLALCPRWAALDRGRLIDRGESRGEDAERARRLVSGPS